MFTLPNKLNITYISQIIHVSGTGNLVLLEDLHVLGHCHPAVRGKDLCTHLQRRNFQVSRNKKLSYFLNDKR